MNYTITILRQADRIAEPYQQTVLFATDDSEMTVATLLKTLNATPKTHRYRRQSDIQHTVGVQLPTKEMRRLRYAD